MTQTYTGNDTSGRAYATVDAVKAGDYVIADDGMKDCMRVGTPLLVETGPHGLYVPCEHGKHYLDGQIETSESGIQFYIGFYPKT